MSFIDINLHFVDNSFRVLLIGPIHYKTGLFFYFSANELIYRELFNINYLETIIYQTCTE